MKHTEIEKNVNKSKGNPSACDSCGEKGCTASTRQKDESAEDFADRQMLQSRLCHIRHIVVVLSGKGGVGKSTVNKNAAL